MGKTVADFVAATFAGPFTASHYLYAYRADQPAGSRDAVVLCTAFQPKQANLTAFGALTLVADRLPYANGTGTLALATFTAAGRALVDDADAAAQRTTLGFVSPILDKSAPGNIGAITPAVVTGTIINATSQYQAAGTKVVGAQGASVADATGGAVIDAEARAALNALLARVRAHGLIA